MNDDEIKEISLLDDKQTKLLEWLEEHPEEREKLLETIRNVMEALVKVAEQFTPTIKAVAELAAAYAEAQRIEEEGEANE